MKNENALNLILEKITNLEQGQKALEQGQGVLVAEVSSLKEGQKALEQGQVALTSEVVSLKEGQKILTSEVADLKEGQKILTSEVADLKEGQKILTSEVAELKEGQKTLEQEQQSDRTLLEMTAAQVTNLLSDFKDMKSDIKSINAAVIKIEDEHGRKLSALFDGYQQNSDKLDRIEKQVSKHEDFIFREHMG